jgi:conjugal transfer pilus assembly protein TraE
VELRRYLEERENLRASNRFLKFFVVVISIAIVLNSFFTYFLMKKQKVVIVPPVYSDKLFIAGSDASDEYLYSMGSFISFLMLTYSPATARIQFNHFLKFCSSPEAFTKFKPMLYSLADKIETASLSSAFFPQKISVNRAEKFLEITGVLNQWTSQLQFITNEVKKYRIKYKIQNGFFMVDDFIEVKQ